MNNDDIFVYSVMILGGLIIAASIIITINWLREKYLGGAFFCFLPSNHTACVAIKGNIVHYLMHKEDAYLTYEALEIMCAMGIIDKAGYRDIAGKIVFHDEGFWGWLVENFNLHLTSINPFASIKPVEVIKSSIREGVTTGSDLEQHILVKPSELQKFLRLSWPRVKYITDVQLENQVVVHLLVQLSKVRVWNLPQIYREFGGKVSEKVDAAIASLFINHLSTMSLTQFQADDMTARVGEKGIEQFGVYLEGPLAVVDWEEGEGQRIITDANLRRAAANVDKETVIIEAQAKREAAILIGDGDAYKVEAVGNAHAKAAEALTKGFGGDAKAAARVAAARELSKPDSPLRVIGGSSIVNLGEE